MPLAYLAGVAFGRHAAVFKPEVTDHGFERIILGGAGDDIFQHGVVKGTGLFDGLFQHLKPGVIDRLSPPVNISNALLVFGQALGQVSKLGRTLLVPGAPAHDPFCRRSKYIRGEDFQAGAGAEKDHIGVVVNLHALPHDKEVFVRVSTAEQRLDIFRLGLFEN